MHIYKHQTSGLGATAQEPPLCLLTVSHRSGRLASCQKAPHCDYTHHTWLLDSRDQIQVLMHLIRWASFESPEVLNAVLVLCAEPQGPVAH